MKCQYPTKPECGRKTHLNGLCKRHHAAVDVVLMLYAATWIDWNDFLQRKIKASRRINLRKKRKVKT